MFFRYTTVTLDPLCYAYNSVIIQYMKKSKKRTAQQRFAANPEIARIIKNLTAITERMDKVLSNTNTNKENK